MERGKGRGGREWEKGWHIHFVRKAFVLAREGRLYNREQLV